MKVSGKLEIQGDGSLLHIEKFSNEAAYNAADEARAIKEHKGGKLLDFVGEDSTPQYSYPLWLEQQWAQQWGLRMDDPALEEVIQIELNSGEYEHFRL